MLSILCNRAAADVPLGPETVPQTSLNSDPDPNSYPHPTPQMSTCTHHRPQHGAHAAAEPLERCAAHAAATSFEPRVRLEPRAQRFELLRRWAPLQNADRHAAKAQPVDHLSGAAEGVGSRCGQCERSRAKQLQAKQRKPHSISVTLMLMARTSGCFQSSSTTCWQVRVQVQFVLCLESRVSAWGRAAHPLERDLVRQEVRVVVREEVRLRRRLHTDGPALCWGFWHMLGGSAGMSELCSGYTCCATVVSKGQRMLCCIRVSNTQGSAGQAKALAAENGCPLGARLHDPERQVHRHRVPFQLRADSCMGFGALSRRATSESGRHRLLSADGKRGVGQRRGGGSSALTL